MIIILEIELTKIAQVFLKIHYGLGLDIPIKRNNRLRSTHGRFIINNYNHTPLRIEIAGKTLDYGTDEVIISILKHECIHYALFVQGRAYRDGHPEFEAELRKHNAPSTNTLKIGLYYLFSTLSAIVGPNVNGWAIQLTGNNYNMIMIIAPVFLLIAFWLMMGVKREKQVQVEKFES